jgi:hypothetical protein
MFTLRFPFRLSSGQSIEIKEDPFVVNGLRWHLSQMGEWYVAKIEGFDSEMEARAYVPTAWTALRWVQLNAALGMEATLEIGEVRYASDPAAAAENLAKSFGMTIEGPVDGLVDGSAPSIYPSSKKMFAITGPDAKVTIITAMERVVELLRECVKFPKHDRVQTDPKLLIGLDLYAAHFSERSIHARFLTLVMVLEALAKSERRAKVVLDILARWGQELSELKKTHAEDPECTSALESVERELDSRVG